MDDVLGGGLVDALDRGRRAASSFSVPDGGDGVLGARAHLGLDGLVALARDHVLLVALDLALDICHEIPRSSARTTASGGPA